MQDNYSKLKRVYVVYLIQKTMKAHILTKMMLELMTMKIWKILMNMVQICTRTTTIAKGNLKLKSFFSTPLLNFSPLHFSFFYKKGCKHFPKLREKESLLNVQKKDNEISNVSKSENC